MYLAFLIVVLLMHVLLIADHIPTEFSFEINGMLVPALIGCISFFLLRGTLPKKLILLAVMPLVLLCGGIFIANKNTDPDWLAWALIDTTITYAFLCLGATLSYCVNAYLIKK